MEKGVESKTKHTYTNIYIYITKLTYLNVSKMSRAFINTVPLPDLVVGTAAGLARVPSVERAHPWVIHTTVDLWFD
jgi:hypothetical protein